MLIVFDKYLTRYPDSIKSNYLTSRKNMVNRFYKNIYHL